MRALGVPVLGGNMRHVNIPVFIPHLGCPNQCVFCNQRTISGTVSFDPASVSETIEDALSTSQDAVCEIAFFGGSFTGIDRSLMIRLLDTAQSYVDSGHVIGIRMSTRPDYIDEEITEILKNYTVTQVELGIQSMSDRVLGISKRGHTSEDSVRALVLLNDSGFKTVGQMMIGLPGATPDDEILTARLICDGGCVAARIYPTVVFKDTELDLMYSSGLYRPLSVEEAVARSADVLKVFDERGLMCLRIGLCDSENLHSNETYSAGPSHPAIGELVEGRVFLLRISEAVRRLVSDGADPSGRTLVIECPRGAVSKVVGNRKANSDLLKKEFEIKKIKTIENDGLLGYNIKVSFI